MKANEKQRIMQLVSRRKITALDALILWESVTRKPKRSKVGAL